MRHRASSSPCSPPAAGWAPPPWPSTWRAPCSGGASGVCLLDFDLYLGDVLSFLDLPGTYSITDVIANMRPPRPRAARHLGGAPRLGAAGAGPERQGRGGRERARRPTSVALLDFLRQHYGHLVVDGVRGFDELSLAVLDASQQIVMVLTQDVPSVRSTKRCLELFRRLGYDDRKIQLVLNRYQRDSKITPEVIAEAVGLPVAHTLSNDFASAIEAINRGLMLQDVAPRSPLTRDIEALAPLLAGEDRARGRAGAASSAVSGRRRVERWVSSSGLSQAGGAGHRRPTSGAPGRLPAGDAGGLRRHQGAAAPAADREAGPQHHRQAAARAAGARSCGSRSPAMLAGARTCRSTASSASGWWTSCWTRSPAWGRWRRCCATRPSPTSWSTPPAPSTSSGGGKLELTGVRFRDNDHLQQIINRIVSRVGRRVDDSSPMVDARLPDGSRVNAIIPPLAIDGADPVHPPLRRQAAALPGPGAHRQRHPGDGGPDGRLRAGQDEHAHQRRHRHRQDHAC